MEISAQDLMRELTLGDGKLLDVRAECEYMLGAVPHSVNVPLLRDGERALVGECYRLSGQAAALNLGNRLVCGRVRAQRIERWSRELRDVAAGYLCCARGGLRSSVSQDWLASEGLHVPRVRGGYKALRAECLSLLGTFRNRSLIVLCGNTGSGKSQFLRDFKDQYATVDLELHARHSGSSFGNIFGGQPSQATFENALAFDVLRSGGRMTLVEDEASKIGALRLPEGWYEVMSLAPRIVLEVPLEERIDRLVTEYVVRPFDSSPDGGSPRSSREKMSTRRDDELLSAVEKLSRRLGGATVRECQLRMRAAFLRERRTGDISLHREWVRILLERYYDPCYERDLDRKSRQIIFRGTWADVGRFLARKAADVTQMGSSFTNL